MVYTAQSRLVLVWYHTAVISQSKSVKNNQIDIEGHKADATVSQ
jgi:hypothetical protein